MSKKKGALITALGYYIVMILALIITNIISGYMGANIVNGMDVNESNIVYKFIMQIPPTLFLIYMINKYFGWEISGFKKINKKNLIWFLPYIVVFIFMLNEFIYEIYTNADTFNKSTYMIIIFTFLGTAMAGFCEEVIFRGIILNTFKNEKSIIPAMILSSLGFSIFHLVTIVMGISIIDVIIRIFYSSLLGFSFVGLAIKINNILPITIFHILWNFILMASEALSLELSSVVGLSNILNIFMAIILWTVILIKEYRNRKCYSKQENLNI